MMNFIGVDIGASTIKVGRVVSDNIEQEYFVDVNREATSEKIVEDLFYCIDHLINEQTQSIGVGVPAVVNPVTGMVYNVQNIQSWKEISLKDLLIQRYDLSVFINNDANCFAIGEKIFGKGRNYQNFVGLSLGTGIGMGVIVNDALYNGVLCGAGEIGMVAYRNGIIEDYASSFFFTKNYGISPKKMFALAERGDLKALHAFKEYGFHLGEVLKNILYIYAPETIIIGGSISKAYTYYKNSIEESLSSFAYQKQLENFKIQISHRPESAIMGAAALCLEDQKS